MKNSDLRHVTVGNILLTDQRILSYYDLKKTPAGGPPQPLSSAAAAPSRSRVSFKSLSDIYYCTEHIYPVNETPRNKHFYSDPCFYNHLWHCLLHFPFLIPGSKKTDSFCGALEYIHSNKNIVCVYLFRLRCIMAVVVL